MQTIVISDTKQMFNGEAFYLCGNYFQHKGKRLHRTVWEYHNGAIPKGYHVHHVDENKANNDISNLQLLATSEHMSHHSSQEEHREKSRKNIAKAIECAKEWHHSEEGKEWHSKHGKESWEKRKPIKYNCTFCNAEFETLNVYSPKSNHFCSNKCKSAYRRKLFYEGKIPQLYIPRKSVQHDS